MPVTRSRVTYAGGPNGPAPTYTYTGTHNGTEPGAPFPMYGNLTKPTRISCQLQLVALRPGIVRVTTPGEHRMVVNHVPLYVDCDVTVYTNGDVKITRVHLVYRYGDQADTVNAQHSGPASRMIRQAVTELLAEFGSEVGTFATDDADAQDRAELHQLRTRRAALDTQLGQARHRQDRLAETIAAAECARAAVDANLDELERRINERTEQQPVS